jgi:hypothetical protein
MPVNAPRKDYEQMLPKWERVRDCSNGRDAVIKAGNKYVPDLPGADTAGNAAYRQRGNFYNAVSRTVQGMNGAIFQDAPEVEMPESSKPILDDITLTNISFETLATESGKEVFLMGRMGVLVDMPLATPSAAGVAANPNPVDMRPYCVTYKAEEIINWRCERRGGDEVLTMVVLHEHAEAGYAEDDPFTCQIIDQYRVVMLNKSGQCVQQIWRQKAPPNGTEYEMFGAELPLMRRGEPLTFVPFVFMGALRPTPDLEQPPLVDLADVNLGHWRNSVDHEYGLHLVALPTPWVSGAKSSNDGTKMKIGPSVVWELDVNGAAGMLEFNGKGLEAIASAMEEKKKQMATLGARLLEDAPTTAETASAVKLRHGGETASLKTVAQSLEQGFTQVLQMCVWWNGVDKMPADAPVEVELNKEYLNIRATPQEIQVALTALQAGEITFETWYDILQKGGWAREGVTAEDEQKAIATKKALTPEPALDPELSTQDPPPPTQKKVVTRTATGYEITQS